MKPAPEPDSPNHSLTVLLTSVTALVAIAGVVLAAIWLAGGPNRPTAAPADLPDPEPGHIVGVALIDNDGDGGRSEGDLAAPSLTVWARSGGALVDPGRFSAVTEQDGRFALELPPSVFEADDLELELRLSEAAPTGFALVAIDDVEDAVEIVLPGVPRTCEADCGERLLPDLVPVLHGVSAAEDQPLPEESWWLDTTSQPGRTLLRFASVTANVGTGPMHVVADRDPSADPGAVLQRVWHRDFTYSDRPAGVFVFHEGHDHTHLEGFERYRLLDADGEVLATAAKVSFCLVDSIALTDPPPPAPSGLAATTIPGQCGADEQAINVGFADYYGPELDDQWIDVTDIDPGRYEVEIVVDPDDVLLELDETNNSVRFVVEW